MKHWIDEQTGCKMCEPDCVDEWLFDIWAIGCDYDGNHSAEDLKKLVDELVDMANKARDCLWDGKLFGIHGSPEEKEQHWIKYNIAADLDPFPDIKYQCPLCYKSFKEEYDECPNCGQKLDWSE